MSFYGKDPAPKPPVRERKLYYYTDGNGSTGNVRAHSVYFYESGHVGFWDDRDEDNDGRLILAIRAHEVWEDRE